MMCKDRMIDVSIDPGRIIAPQDEGNEMNEIRFNERNAQMIESIIIVDCDCGTQSID